MHGYETQPDTTHFINDIKQQLLDVKTVADFNTAIQLVIDKHAPLRTRVITERPDTSWFNSELKIAKSEKRKMESLKKARLHLD